jgi:hypothetical protein
MEVGGLRRGVVSIQSIVRGFSEQALHCIDWVGDALKGKVNVVIGGLVAAQHTAPVRCQVQVDEGLDGEVSGVGGAGLEAEQWVEVDRSELEPLGPGVVGVDGATGPDRVLLVAAVAWAGLRQAEGEADGGLQLARAGGSGQQVGEVTEDSLWREESEWCFWMTGFVRRKKNLEAEFQCDVRNNKCVNGFCRKCVGAC